MKLLGPRILEVKPIMLEFSKLKNSVWDDVIPECMIVKWKNWYQDLSYLLNLSGFGLNKKVIQTRQGMHMDLLRKIDR